MNAVDARRLVLRRFGIVKETARADRVYIDLDFPKKQSRRLLRARRLPLNIARGVLPISVIRAVCSIIGLKPTMVRYDRTARGFHVVIYLPWRQRLPRAECVALQLCLGSDARRETLNLMRARSIRQHGAPPHFRNRWNLLFERKLTDANTDIF